MRSDSFEQDTFGALENSMGIYVSKWSVRPCSSVHFGYFIRTFQHQRRYDIFDRDLEEFKAMMRRLSQQQGLIQNNITQITTKYSEFLHKAYKYHIMSEVLPKEKRQHTENIMIGLYTNCTNTGRNDGSAFHMHLMLPPSWLSIRSSTEEIRVVMSQLHRSTLQQQHTTSEVQAILVKLCGTFKSVLDTFRPSNCITLREELDLMVKAGRCTVPNAWMALSSCVKILTWAKGKWDEIISKGVSQVGDLFSYSWDTLLESIRRFRFRFVLQCCANTWPQLQRRSVLKKKKRKRKRKNVAKERANESNGLAEERSEKGGLSHKGKYDYEPARSIMRSAVKAVLNGEDSTPVVADQFGIPTRTLRRYVAKEREKSE